MKRRNAAVHPMDARAMHARAMRVSATHASAMDASAMDASAMDANARQTRARDAIAVELLADVLARHGEHRLIAHGQSMKGAIASGSVLHLRRAVPSEPVAFGAVVAARVAGLLIVHRVVGRDACDRVLLKGDACPSPDGWIPQDDVIGVVVAVNDGSGFRPVSAPRPPLPRWQRALRRLQRSVFQVQRESTARPP